MDEQTYIEERLESQIQWFDQKSIINKRWYRRCQLTQLIAASLITLSGIFIGESFLHLRYLIPFLGAVIAIISGVLGLYKFQENWIQYRTTSETLKHEKYLFLTRSEPYSGKDSLKLLVERVEGMISKENTNWSQYVRRVYKPKSTGLIKDE